MRRRTSLRGRRVQVAVSGLALVLLVFCAAVEPADARDPDEGEAVRRLVIALYDGQPKIMENGLPELERSTAT